MKKFFTATGCAVFALGCACAFAGCGDSGKDYTDEITALQQQVKDLQNELNSLKNSNSTDYTAEINALKQQIKTLETKCNSANTSITKLQQDLNAAKLRLDAIEGAMQADKNYTYQMGEVCTVKSASGLELFKIRLLEYDTDLDRLIFNFQRVNFPSYMDINDYFTIAVYSESKNAYNYKYTTAYHDDDYTDFNKILYTGFNGSVSISSSEFSYFIIGIPSDNSKSTNDDKSYIIPYAIYNL